ncbi:hypothetical protein D3C74_382020 [compost metagenome]
MPVKSCIIRCITQLSQQLQHFVITAVNVADHIHPCANFSEQRVLFADKLNGFGFFEHISEVEAFITQSAQRTFELDELLLHTLLSARLVPALIPL